MMLWRLVARCPQHPHTSLAPGVVLAVVDPGVGTARRAVAVGVETPFGPLYLVGPDNGLLRPAALALEPARTESGPRVCSAFTAVDAVNAELAPPVGPGAAALVNAEQTPPVGPGAAAPVNAELTPPVGPGAAAPVNAELTPPAGPGAAAPATPPMPLAAPGVARLRAVVLPAPTWVPGGATFDGRDLFAPAAARLAAGAALEDLGDPIDPTTLAGPAPPSPRRIGPSQSVADRGVRNEPVVATVLWVDHFGNAQLDVTVEPGCTVTAYVGGVERILPSVASFEALGGRVGLVVDSYGLSAVCLERASAAVALGLDSGTSIGLRLADPAEQRNRR
jgi:S-adenosylmethionine hydrolase